MNLLLFCRSSNDGCHRRLGCHWRLARQCSLADKLPVTPNRGHQLTGDRALPAMTLHGQHVGFASRGPLILHAPHLTIPSSFKENSHVASD